ncbi:MAG: trypsin-like peptidase domain-containing protein, partial [Planctomycetota bacterium]
MRYRYTRILFLATVGIFAATATADAQRWGWRRTWARNGSATRAAFSETIEAARAATVRLEVDKKLVALGTCVHADGWILTKASTVPLAVDCVLPDGRRVAAVRRATIEEHDLALFSVSATDLTVVDWQVEEPTVGRWIAVPGHADVPVAVGVVSVPSRTVEAERGFLGVEIHDYDDAGALIKAVIDDTPAQRAGLAADDVVVRVNGATVRNRSMLVSNIRKVGAGGALELLVRRGDKEVTVRAIVGQRNFDPKDIENSGPVSLRHSGFPAAFQHDAVIAPSQCGGPVVDLSGKVVGVAIARANRSPISPTAQQPSPGRCWRGSASPGRRLNP